MDMGDYDDEFSSQQRASFKNNETNCGYLSEMGSDTSIFKNEYFEPRMDDASTSSSDTPQQPLLPQGLQQAQKEFHKVMGLLQSALEQKLSEQPNCTIPVVAPKDPFYNYLESILNRVEHKARAEIQLMIINLANSLVKDSQNTN